MNLLAVSKADVDSVFHLLQYLLCWLGVIALVCFIFVCICTALLTFFGTVCSLRENWKSSYVSGDDNRRIK